MAAITNAQAVSFSDREVRVFADLRISEYYAAKKLVNDWNGLSLSSLFPNDSSALQDGANPATGPADGRPPITGAMVTNVITRALEVITDLEANTNAKLNTLLAVHVNGASPF